jgi:pyruvate dehydrogenase E2 component (dihydrolipoamide acetyltransferase)
VLLTEADILIPHLGVSVQEASVTTWLVQVGQEVTEGQPVCEITTDKVDIEVEAPVAGVISEILVAAGDFADVGKPLARIAVHGTGSPVPSGATSPPAPSAGPGDAQASSTTPPPQPRPTVAAESTRAAGSPPGPPGSPAGPAADQPSVASLLSGAHIDPAAAARIVTSRRAAPAARTPAASGPAASGPAAPAPGPATQPDGPAATALPRGYDDVPHEIVRTTSQRRAIASHMRQSRATAAHMTTEVDVDMQPVAAARSALNSEREPSRARLSYLPLVCKAAISALREFPDLNATFRGDDLVRWTEVNLAIAVDTAHGLIAPVIRDAGHRTLDSIAEQIIDLAGRARARTLLPEDLRAGTFTISNPGSAGAVSAPAIINQPQVAILGLPAIIRRPIVVTGPEGDEMIAIRPIARLALTFDHRAVDGADATRYLVAVRQRLESWTTSHYR